VAEVRLRPVGPRALLIEAESPAAAAAWQETVLRLADDGVLPRPIEVVPGARTLLLDGVDAEAVRQVLAGLGPPGPDPARADSPVVEIPVTYDGADLAEVARLWGVTEAEVVARHTATEFRVAFCGFAPGFPYLEGLDVQVPRRATPRTSVPAGSVGLAGRYCGIYPGASPGGWQLLGRTGAQLFDVDRDPPALLPPGTRVRFVEAAGQQAPPQRKSSPASSGGRSITVVRAGALTTLQDGGRLGVAHLGVPRAGALDAEAARLANRLVGNDRDAAVLETTLTGVAVRAGTALTVAVTGASGAVSVDGRPAEWGLPISVPAGAVLDVSPATVGVRSYVAVAGGIAVPPVLGSRSRDTLSGLGSAPLAVDDVLPVGPVGDPPPAVDFTVPEPARAEVVLRLHPGPRTDWFGEPGIASLREARYTLSPSSNRVGARLSGPAVPRLVDGELESEGMVLGGVQVPPDGQPVVLLADHPTTGGYPVIGVVDPRDLPALAQARPGTPVRFVLDRSTWP
jgi:KipI family sensor histidine kinase inhibitor